MALAALKGAWPSRPELKLILSVVAGYTLLVDFVAVDLTDDEIGDLEKERDEFRKQERAFNDYLGKVLQDIDLDCAVAYDLRPCTMDLS